MCKILIPGKRICKIAADNADNTYFRKCIESGDSTRYICNINTNSRIYLWTYKIEVDQDLFLLDLAGSAIGFKLDSLLKLSDTRAKNNKMTLMHYLCKVECWRNFQVDIEDYYLLDLTWLHLSASSIHFVCFKLFKTSIIARYEYGCGHKYKDRRNNCTFGSLGYFFL